MNKQYRKKPVIIEAELLTKDENGIKNCLKFMGDTSDFTSQIGADRFHEYCNDLIKENKGLRIKTLESDGETQIASFGDYIIKGVKGEFYPCKPEIFEMTYEKI